MVVRGVVSSPGGRSYRTQTESQGLQGIVDYLAANHVAVKNTILGEKTF